MWRTIRFYNADAPAGDAAPAVTVEAAAPEAVPAAEVSPAPAEAESSAPAPVAEEKPAETDAAPWNGEMEHLVKQPWWAKLDEPTRKDVEAGLKSKWSNLEAGYSKKFQELAETRKAPAEWETEKAKLNDQLRDLQLLHDILGDGDKDTAGKIEAERARILAEHTAAVDKLKADYAAEMDPLRKELEDHRAFRAEIEKEREAAYQKQVDDYAATMAKKYGDILTNKDAADRFEKLLQGAVSDEEMDEAAAFVRQRFGIKAPKLPAAAEHASRGDGARVEADDVLPEGLSPDEMILRAARRAAARRR